MNMLLFDVVSCCLLVFLLFLWTFRAQRVPAQTASPWQAAQDEDWERSEEPFQDDAKGNWNILEILAQLKVVHCFRNQVPHAMPRQHFHHLSSSFINPTVDQLSNALTDAPGTTLRRPISHKGEGIGRNVAPYFNIAMENSQFLDGLPESTY